MNTPTRSLMAALMMTTLAVAPLAEAKRMGGGKNSGMSRSTQSNTSTSTNNSTAQPVQPVSPVAASPVQAAPKPASGIGMGTVAGAAVAAGAVGYMMGSSSDANATPPTATSENPVADPATKASAPAEEQGGLGWLWLIVLAAVGFFLFRRFAGKKAAAPAGHNPFQPQPTPFAQPQGFGQPSSGNNIFGQPVGGANAAPSGGFSPSSPFVGGDTLPDGTTKAAFLRQARSTFLHLQTMNSSSHIEELRRYFTPQMFESVRHEIANNHDTAEFPQMNAQVIDTTTENGQYVVSVRFNGMVSEALDAPTQPFSEVWHFVKPTTGGEWLVAGIQQD